MNRYLIQNIGNDNDRKIIQVEFQDADKNGEDASVCWKTCSLIYPNTSLALISKTNFNIKELSW